LSVLIMFKHPIAQRRHTVETRAGRSHGRGRDTGHSLKEQKVTRRSMGRRGIISMKNSLNHNEKRPGDKTVVAIKTTTREADCDRQGSRGQTKITD